MFFYIVLTPISTTFGLRSTGNTRKYQQIDVYIYQCECVHIFLVNLGIISQGIPTQISVIYYVLHLI